MKTIYIKTIWLFFIAFAIASCTKEKDKEPCDPNDKESPCYAGPNGNGNGNGSGNTDPGDNTQSGTCWYKVTIDGQAVTANAFGKDQILLNASMDAETGETAFSISLNQAKEKGSKKSTLTAAIYGHLNSESPLGDYPVGLFSSNRFNTSDYQQYPVYIFGDEEEFDHEEAYMSSKLIENSEKRLHVKIAGVALGRNGAQEIGLFPVEAEVIMAREYIYEAPVNGEVFSGGKCDCQEE